jgi:hypothetical protein
MEIWLPILFASFCYLTPSLLLFKKPKPDKKLTAFNAALVGVGLLAHFTILITSISFHPIDLSFANALIATSFFSIMIFWVLNFNKNFILSAMNLAFLSFYSTGVIKKKKYLINWPDGIFSRTISDLNIKIPGREIIRSLKIPKIIKKITVIGNLSYKSKLFLENLYKMKIKNIKLPYGNINLILKNFKYKTSKNELIFTTLPTPKQELVAHYIANKNKEFKIICIGGSIAIASGDEKEVPKYLARLEFLWRLRYETRRRIFRLIISFIYYIKGKYLNKTLKNLKIIYEY